MKKITHSLIRRAVLALLFAFVLFASISSDLGEWYARNLYPSISKILSAFSSPVLFSLDEWAVVFGILLLVGYPFYARKRKGKKWLSVLGGEVEIILWIYVWFYWGWGMNYYRASFFQRAEIRPAAYDDMHFKEFLADYTHAMKSSFALCREERSLLSSDWLSPAEQFSEQTDTIRKTSFPIRRIQQQIKDTYRRVPTKFGLSSPQEFQHPKRSSFNSLYSNVGVLGFMGPFFAESHLNHELSKLEYPFTYAHELSHLLGISSEAEANFWAYTICTHSEDPFIRFSGYFGLFSYLWLNAQSLLSPAEFDRWESSVPAEVMAAFYHTHAYWSLRYNRTLGEVQSALYNFYLKRNRIASGQKNYGQVISLLLSLPDYKVELSIP